MKRATSIKLPAGYKPRFPDKCIVCHETPNSTVTISQSSANPLLALFAPIFHLFGWSRTKAPICRGCKPRFLLQRWSRLFFMVGLAILALTFAMPRLSGLSRGMRRIVGLLIAAVVISPVALFHIFWPPIFDTTASGDSIDYEFASQDYAIWFAAMNVDALQ